MCTDPFVNESNTLREVPKQRQAGGSALDVRARDHSRDSIAIGVQYAYTELVLNEDGGMMHEGPGWIGSKLMDMGLGYGLLKLLYSLLAVGS